MKRTKYRREKNKWEGIGGMKEMQWLGFGETREEKSILCSWTVHVKVRWVWILPSEQKSCFQNRFPLLSPSLFITRFLSSYSFPKERRKEKDVKSSITFPVYFLLCSNPLLSFPSPVFLFPSSLSLHSLSSFWPHFPVQNHGRRWSLLGRSRKDQVTRKLKTGWIK